MRGTNNRVIRAAAAVCAAAVMLIVSAAPALADGAGAQTMTVTFKNAVIPLGASLNPCSGATGAMTAISVNGVIHETVNKAGDVWDTGALTGVFQFVPDAASQPTYTGHGTAWFGDSINNQNFVNHFTFHFNATGTDGSTIAMQETGHISSNANGVPVVVFDKQSATCG